MCESYLYLVGFFKSQMDIEIKVKQKVNVIIPSRRELKRKCKLSQKTRVVFESSLSCENNFKKLILQKDY